MVIIFHQKVIISPQKCALIPQNISFNHISLTFSLTKMIYALLSKNVVSRIYALLLAKFAKVPGSGPNGIPGFSIDQNPGIFYYEIPGFFGICLKSVKGLFKVRQDLLPRPLEVKIFSQ